MQNPLTGFARIAIHRPRRAAAAPRRSSGGAPGSAGEPPDGDHRQRQTEQEQRGRNRRGGWRRRRGSRAEGEPFQIHVRREEAKAGRRDPVKAGYGSDASGSVGEEQGPGAGLELHSTEGIVGVQLLQLRCCSGGGIHGVEGPHRHTGTMCRSR